MALHKFLMFLTTLTITSMAYECPDIRGCSTCRLYLEDNSYLYRCPATGGPTFSIRYRTQRYVHLECEPSANWSDLIASNLPDVQNAYLFSLGKCSLPTNESLIEITKQLGMKNVTNLIIKDMRLGSQLKSLHFMNFYDVRNLTLSSLSLTNIDDNLLQGMPNLEKLDLRNNNINISKKLFSYVPKLRLLELAQNDINFIQPGLFEELKNLRLLNLWYNKMRKLENGAFKGLQTLTSLDLHGNLIQEVEEDVFLNLQNLAVINLSRNNFTKLPEGLFRGNRRLKKVIMSNLKSIGKIPKNIFSNSTTLTDLKLISMGVKELDGDIFSHLRDLRKLTLISNGIQHLPDRIFYGTNRLTAIDLSYNNLTVINRGIFYNLYFLEELNLSNNHLKIIHRDAFKDLQNLRIAKLSYNQLTFEYDFGYPFEYNSPLGNSLKVKELDLKHNNISKIFRDWRILDTQLEKLDLSYNNLRKLRSSDIHFVSTNLRVNLKNNSISEVELHDAELYFPNQRYPRNMIIEMESNPINCDCSIFNFLRYLEGKMDSTVQNYVHINPGNLVCQEPDYMKGLEISNIKSDKLQCLVEEKCPKECRDCWRRPSNQAYVVDCSFRNLSRAPIALFPKKWEQVELNLTGNYLTSLPSKNQPGYGNVTVLLASDNLISRIDSENLITSLQVLELNHNELERLSTEVLTTISKLPLKNLTLHDNPWQCNCESRILKNFVHEKFSSWSELGKMSCGETGFRIVELTEDDFCSTKTITIILGVAIAVAGIVIGTIAALYYRYNTEIKIWLFARHWCLRFVTEEDLDKDKPFDVFISYSHKDEDFVANELVSTLERGPYPFKLCLHHRDWIAGDLIPVQIARSVQNSKRTIIVLSANFLKSVWGAMEFRLAHRKALEEGRTRLIVILYGDIPSAEKLDPELQAYLSMNTYVKWGDKWFWEKLRYALPHHPGIKNKKDLKNIFENQIPTISSIHDKSCMIESSLNKPLSSTPPNETCEYNTVDKKSSLLAEIIIDVKKL